MFVLKLTFYLFQSVNITKKIIINDKENIMINKIKKLKKINKKHN